MRSKYNPERDLDEKTLRLEEAIEEYVISIGNNRMIFTDLLEPFVKDFREAIIFIKYKLNSHNLVTLHINRIKSNGLEVIY